MFCSMTSQTNMTNISILDSFFSLFGPIFLQFRNAASGKTICSCQSCIWKKIQKKLLWVPYLLISLYFKLGHLLPGWILNSHPPDKLIIYQPTTIPRLQPLSYQRVGSNLEILIWNITNWEKQEQSYRTLRGDKALWNSWWANEQYIITSE